MKVFELLKPNGKTRKIYSPDKNEKRTLRSIVPQLNLLAEKLDVFRVQHGFTEGRSPVTNAKSHIGWQFSLCFDLSDFFDSVTETMVVNAIPISPELERLRCIRLETLFPDGAARQGLPTSPALANIAASPMDAEIMGLLKASRFSKPPFVYTRYADDLTFSADHWPVIQMLLERIPQIVEKHGFKLNEAKTKIQCAKAGRRMITGVAVGETDVYVPRETRRKIRAGLHQTRDGLRRRNIRRMLFKSRQWRRRLPLVVRLRLSVRGLQEWAKLKLPKERRGNKPNPVSAAVGHAVAVVCHSAPVQCMLGFFRRKLE